MKKYRNLQNYKLNRSRKTTKKKMKEKSKRNVDNVYQSALDREFFASPRKSTLNVRPFVIIDDVLNFLPAGTNVSPTTFRVLLILFTF